MLHAVVVNRYLNFFSFIHPRPVMLDENSLIFSLKLQPNTNRKSFDLTNEQKQKNVKIYRLQWTPALEQIKSFDNIDWFKSVCFRFSNSKLFCHSSSMIILKYKRTDILNILYDVDELYPIKWLELNLISLMRAVATYYRYLKNEKIKTTIKTALNSEKICRVTHHFSLYTFLSTGS